MMKQIICIVSIACSLLCSCDQDQHQRHTADTNPRILKINPESQKEFRYSNFIQQIDYIPLRAPRDILLGTIVKVKRTKNMFFLLDEYKKIFVFDDKGRYLHSIGSVGRGPGEYSHPFDFILDTIQNTIEVYCRGNRKLIKYKISDGEFIGETQINFDFDNFYKTDDGNYLINGMFQSNGSNTSLKLLNSNGSDEGLSFPYPTGLSEHALDIIHMARPTNAFNQNRDGILYTRNLDNNIYLVHGEDIQIKYTMDFGDANLPLIDSYFQKHKTLKTIFYNSNKALFLAGHWSCDSYIYLFVRYKGERLYIFYNGFEDSLFYGSTRVNDVDFGTEFYIAGADDQSLIGMVSPDKFLDNYSTIEKNQELWDSIIQINPQILELYHNLEFDDNPILAICKLK